MSADNYMLIVEGADGRWRGYMGFASDEETNEEIIRNHREWFNVATLDEAIGQAESEYLEYGYRIITAADRLAGIPGSQDPEGSTQ